MRDTRYFSSTDFSCTGLFLLSNIAITEEAKKNMPHLQSISMDNLEPKCSVWFRDKGRISSCSLLCS